MTAPELIDALHRAGGTLVVEGGQTRLRGANVSAELKTALKQQRAEVIAEWQRRQQESRDRYAVVPTGPVPMYARGLPLVAAEREAVMAYVLRQPRPVHAWVMARSNEYFECGVNADDTEWHACVDVIAWQRDCTGLEAVKFLKAVPASEGMDS